MTGQLIGVDGEDGIVKMVPEVSIIEMPKLGQLSRLYKPLAGEPQR